MDGYPSAYIAHNIPLLVISGLGSAPDEVPLSNGIRIASEIPAVETEDAETLLRHFKESDTSKLAWNGREHTGRNKFRVKSVARDYYLPARSASLPDSSFPINSNTRPVAHSPLSPLTPGSSLFPDGLLDPKWVEKHQDLVPSAFVSCYTLTSNPHLATKFDNQLKTDISNTKSILSGSGYRTRLIIALLSEKPVAQSPDIEERLVNIRKHTGLDLKTSIFLLPPNSSMAELQAFAETILSTVYPLSIEYYRDLSKHSRRKRNRGIVPPPTAPPTSGTSQTLSSQGWNVRYDFKLGVFAEFRQEMDAAVRSYEGGYEGLLGPDIMETIASWSPRWDQARLLADIFAIRILRCLLWNNNTTYAVRRWQSHRERMRDLVDRRGKGSSTYGWAAWEARWATVMAEMIKKVSVLEFNSSAFTIHLPPEKAITIGERTQPWELLHHPGYWYYAASNHLISRRKLAMAIPEEDRSPPGYSPASTTASKAYTYDTYLCPEPHEENPLPGREGVDHTQLLVACLSSAIAEFTLRGQSRIAQELQLVSGKEFIRAQAWNDALHTLRPLWQKMSYRNEGWWNAVEEVSWALRKAAVNAGDGGSIIAVDWELMNNCFTQQPQWHYDISKSLEGLEVVKSKPVVVLHDGDIHSFLSAAFTFEHAEGKVGEICPSQLSITSSAITSSAPVNVSEIKLELEGTMKPIVLKHKTRDDEGSVKAGFVQYTKVSLFEEIQDGRPVQSGDGHLTIRPGDCNVYEFSSLLREAGEARAVSATFSITSDLFDLEYVHRFEPTPAPDLWWGPQAVKKRIARANASSILILPKPPKMELRFSNIQQQYYTNEPITLTLDVLNEEDEDSIANLEVRLLGEGAPAITLNVASSLGSKESEESNELIGTPLGKIAKSASTMVEILIPPIIIPSVYDLALKASYNLVSDIETPINRTMTIQVEVISPFEANYDFSPRIHPDPWPSFFTHTEGQGESAIEREARAHGLAQKWCLTARYASFATEDLIIEDMSVKILGINGGIICNSTRLTTIPESGLKVSPKSLEEALFDVCTQKLSLDDRGTATLDVSLAINWRRTTASNSSLINTTTLAVPHLLVSSSEPRVLAAVSYSATIPLLIHFEVTIENPSNHFLTFGLSMEPSEKFAFSGSKQSTLQLVPLSRRTVRFRLLPGVRGDWVGPVQCVIKDRYFQKVLRIAPTEGLRIDKEGILVWVPPEEES